MYARPRFWPPYLPIVRLRIIDVRAPRGANAHRRPPLRRAGLPGHVPGRPRRASWACRSRRSTTTSTRRKTCSGRSPGKARRVPRGARRRARRAPRPERIRLALRAHLARRRGPARHRDRLRARVALPRGRAAASGSSPSAAATRSGSATSSAKASSAASCAPISTSRPPALLFLSAANWAYTWLRPGRRHRRARRSPRTRALLDGMRGYATPLTDRFVSQRRRFGPSQRYRAGLRRQHAGGRRGSPAPEPRRTRMLRASRGPARLRRVRSLRARARRSRSRSARCTAAPRRPRRRASPCPARRARRSTVDLDRDDPGRQRASDEHCNGAGVGYDDRASP